MSTNHHKIAISIGSLVASGLLSSVVPTGTSGAAFWKPPRPCVAVDAGVYAVGAGFCHETIVGHDSRKVVGQLHSVAA